MALKLIKSCGKNSHAGYIPNWYAVYRDGEIVRTISLGIPLRGLPPTSGNLDDKGNREFEHSRKDAQAELDRRISEVKERRSRMRAAEKEKGEAIRETAEIIEKKTGRKFDNPKLTELADKYLNRIGERSKYHVAMIESCFEKFATFAAKPTNGIPPALTLIEVTDELATAFFRNVSKSFSFSTVRRWANLLSGAFNRFAPIGISNPFKGARLAAVGRAAMKTTEDGEKVKIETVIHHRPLDRQELQKLLKAAKDDTILYHLAITSACTGLRIGDAAQLRFSDCDLKNGIVTLTAAKTGTKVGIPIFDHDPQSPNYEPELGEFRRHLETALASASETEKYVCPEAARLYQKVVRKNGKTYYVGRDAIYSRGKALFAKALFSDEAKIKEVCVNKDTAAKTNDEIIASINTSNWNNERKLRAITVFNHYSAGETYQQIHEATHLAKSTISTDIYAIERLAGASIAKKPNQKPSIRKLLTFTRQRRTVGARSASTLSWHSLRCSFVVLMCSNNVPLETVKMLVGHTTAKQTLEYNNPTIKMAAETARRIIAERNRLTSVNHPTLAAICNQCAELSPNQLAAIVSKLQTLIHTNTKGTPEIM